MPALRQWAVAVCMATLVAAMPSLAAAPVEIVIHPKTPTDSLTQASLRAIFSMRLRQWPDGTPVTVYVLPDRNETHIAFSKQILRTYPYVLRDNWDRMVFI